MWDVVLDALIDSAKILVIVFALHVLLSFFEGKIAKVLAKGKRFGPIVGAAMGLVPECGVSVVGADFYGKGHISLGTLVAIFLACSDEALPMLFANFTSTWYMSFVLIGLKLVIAILIGFLVDFIYVKGRQKNHEHLEHCHGETEIHHGCCGHVIEEGEEENPWHSHLLHPVIHSLKIFAYCFALNLGFGTLVYFVGEANIANWVVQNRYLTPLLSVAVGLIPNCVSSVILADLYLNGALPFGALLAGLLVNSGLGMLILFRKKETLKSGLLVLGIGVAVSLVAGYAFLFVF